MWNILTDKTLNPVWLNLDRHRTHTQKPHTPQRHPDSKNNKKRIQTRRNACNYAGCFVSLRSVKLCCVEQWILTANFLIFRMLQPWNILGWEKPLPSTQFRHCDGRHSIVTISIPASKIPQRGGGGRAWVEPVERGATLQNFFPKKSLLNTC